MHLPVEEDEVQVRPVCHRLGSPFVVSGGRPGASPTKAADVLIALLVRDGQLVTKDELLKEVWPDTFVEEGNLARHIFLLRKTLGETPDGASYVETVPKRGYRFVGPVERDNSNFVNLTAEERTTEHIVIEEVETPEPRILRGSH